MFKQYPVDGGLHVVLPGLCVIDCYCFTPEWRVLQHLIHVSGAFCHGDGTEEGAFLQSWTKVLPKLGVCKGTNLAEMW